MSAHRSPTTAIIVLLVLLAGPVPLHSNSSKNRWWIGAGAGYHTTEDTIANNAGTAAIAINVENDPRPADFISREISVEDTLAFAISAGYGMSDRFTLQLDAGWFRGEVGSIDAYRAETFPTTNSFNPQVTFMREREAVIPVIAGELTEIPIFLSGVVRFFTDRPFNPYVGAGVGMVFTEIEGDSDVSNLNERLATLRVRAVFDDRGREITPDAYKSLKGIGRVPLTHPITLDVDDAFAVNFMAGLEYFPADRMSIVADVRYTMLEQEIRIDLGDEDQVTFFIWSEGLFRPDGSLKYFLNRGGFPNPYRNGDPNQGFVTCALTSFGDFDKDGHKDDLCYSDADARGTPGGNPPTGHFLVQGGKIDLSGFTASIGMRFHFR